MVPPAPPMCSTTIRAEMRLDPLRELPRHGVDHAAGGERNDQPHRAIGIFRLGKRRQRRSADADSASPPPRISRRSFIPPKILSCGLTKTI